MNSPSAPVAAVRDASWRRRSARSWAFDAAVTVLSLIAALPSILSSAPAPEGAAAAVALVLAAAVIARRAWPVPVFGAMIVLAAASGWFVPTAVVSPALVIALYTVAAHCSRLMALASALALSAGVLAWTLRMHQDLEWWPAAVLLVMIVVATTALGLYVATRRRLLLELRDRAVALEHERDQQGELAAAAERERIAREMHDILAHHLTVMVALADGAAAQSRRSPDRAGEAMRTVSTTGRQALADTRRLLGALRTDDEPETSLTPLPGVADLDGLIAGTRAAGLAVRYTVEGAGVNLSRGTQLAVFRLVQEALTNTMKHAAPHVTATVGLRYREEELLIDVIDSGPAAPDRQATAGSSVGRGLLGMGERIALTGGHVDCGPEPDGGWAVRARVPTGSSLTAAS